MGSQHPPTRAAVLVVEDETLIRFHAMDIAEAAGFEAIGAASATEACELLERRDDIRIVFTDINLQGNVDGLELASVIRDRWPPVELIITSGAGRPKDRVWPERGVFLGKPYEAEALAGALRLFRPFH